MERELEERVLSYMREKHMIEEKQAILAGVSGGADSVCLLLLLCSLKSRLDLRLFVVHVEHGIRGEESLADARFVRDLCKRLSVPCQVCPVDVPGRAKRLGQSLEEAGRTARYEIFEREARALEERHGRKCRIAVAHNANDNAETMLYHLARGTGIRGLAGIPPVRGRIIRPLLALKREEIEAYLEEKGQKFCRDATNETDLYRRNRIRHRILPVMEELNPEAVRHMGRTGEMLGELDAWLQEVADRVLGEAVEPDGLRKEPLRKLPEPLRREVLHRWIARIWGGKPGHLLPPCGGSGGTSGGAGGQGDMASGGKKGNLHLPTSDDSGGGRERTCRGGGNAFRETTDGTGDNGDGSGRIPVFLRPAQEGKKR